MHRTQQESVISAAPERPMNWQRTTSCSYLGPPGSAWGNRQLKALWPSCSFCCVMIWNSPQDNSCSFQWSLLLQSNIWRHFGCFRHFKMFYVYRSQRRVKIHSVSWRREKICNKLSPQGWNNPMSITSLSVPKCVQLTFKENTIQHDWVSSDCH